MTGIQQLKVASTQIGVMQEQLEALEPKLKVAAETVENCLNDIFCFANNYFSKLQVAEQVAKVQADSEIAAIQREQVKKDEAAATEQAKIAEAIKEECDSKLSEAMPILNAALAALNTLTPADIAIVRTMRSPPIGVKVVMEAVCILKDIKPEKIQAASGVGMTEDYWGSSKKLLGDMKFLDGLLNFDKDNIPPKVIQKLQERIMTNENFDPEKVKVASTACEGLCRWIIAIVKYDAVAKVIAPKRAALMEAETEYNVKLTVTYFENNFFNISFYFHVGCKSSLGR